MADFLVQEKHTIFASFIQNISQSFFSEKFWFTLLDAGQVVGSVLATIFISLLKILGVLIKELLSFEEDRPFDDYSENSLGQFFGEIDNSPRINTASGLPMIKDSCFDVAGNLYSTNSSWHI